MGLIRQRLAGIALILGALALSYVIYGAYWFSLEATTFGKAANIAIVVIFLVVGVLYLVKRDSKTSFGR